MPVSSPSYFPAVRGTDQIVGLNAGLNQIGARVILGGQGAGSDSTVSDLVLLGHEAGGNLGTGLRFADNAGTTVVGSQSLSSIAFAGGNGPSIVLGPNNAPLAQRADGCVLIGNQIALVFTGDGLGDAEFTRNVCIGHQILSTLLSPTACTNNVVIGHRALVSNGTISNCSANVVIGDDACSASKNSLTGNVVIGANAASSLGAPGLLASENVLIGENCAATMTNGTRNTVVGFSADPGPFRFNTLLGATNTAAGDSNTLLGYGIGLAGDTLTLNVIIGAQADTGETNLTTAFIVGTTDPTSGIVRTILYGNMTSGNLIVGNQSASRNRDFRGSTQPTNALKLLNGTAGTGTNPTGGGFFYVVAGALHWKGSAGTDTVIAPA